MHNKIASYPAPLCCLGVIILFVCGCDTVGPERPYVYGSEQPVQYIAPPVAVSEYQPQPLVMPDAQAEYNAALTAYNQAVAQYNAAFGISKLEDANWQIQQNAAPGIGKLLAFGGAVFGSANREDAVRNLNVARHRLMMARQRLLSQ